MSVIKNIGLLIAFTVLAGLIALGMMLLALWIAVHMVAPLPVDASTDVLAGSSSLKVVNNYSEQKTADIHVIEPKVSDVYYQNTVDANVLQQAKYNHNTQGTL